MDIHTKCESLQSLREKSHQQILHYDIFRVETINFNITGNKGVTSGPVLCLIP